MKTPDRWCLVRVSDDLVKVMGVWSGGYLYGDSWSLNSGVEKVESTPKAYFIHGFSGSVYECRKTAYGLTSIGASVLNALELSPMEQEAAFRFLKLNPKSAHHAPV